MKFSEAYKLGKSQSELDFVDVSNLFDTPVYVDPYALEISDDEWSAQASEHIRSFFECVLEALREGEDARAAMLMSHLTEPKETYLGVSQDRPAGRGVGPKQSAQLIKAIKYSKAYNTGLLTDLSEMSLYVDNFDRDKVSDLTTNILRKLLVKYTQEQCDLYGIGMKSFSSPPGWEIDRKNWVSFYTELPYIGEDPVMLVPKHCVRRRPSLDSQEFYNKQITDFLVSEQISANSSLVHTLKSGKKKVYKSAVRKRFPKSKSFIADIVRENPHLLALYKEAAKHDGPQASFGEDEVSINTVCRGLRAKLHEISPGKDGADAYHQNILGAFTALFYPNLIQPHKEWDINDGRKRIDIVYTNSGNFGFFAQRRDDPNTNANFVVVECKNYSSDIKNPEFDQLLGRFSNSRGKFGFITCRTKEDKAAVIERCRDAVKAGRGTVIVLDDADMEYLLEAKGNLEDERVDGFLYDRLREVTS